MKTLSDYVQTLQREKSELVLKITTLENDLEESQVNTKESSQVQDSKMRILESANKQLKEESTQLRTLKVFYFSFLIIELLSFIHLDIGNEHVKTSTLL